jgi:hypothetical protein
MERIIQASSNPGDIVADFFCGSGTTPIVAARLGRRFIAGDLTWRAVHTTHARLAASSASPFLLQRTSGAAIPLQHVELEGCQLVINKGKGSISLPSRLIEDCDFWEIDPAWDGKMFRSCAQAVRPLRGRESPDRLAFPPTESALPVCIRLVKTSGEHFQGVIK